MLKVADYELIRRKVLVDGESRRSVASELGHSRKTVSKALDHSSPPGYRRIRPVSRPVIDPFKEIIEAWLDEDKSRPRKQRHSAKRIYDRLVDEHDFQGSSSAVRRYVAQVKKDSREVFFPLSFDPGEECQVDFGHAYCVLGGVTVQVVLFCLRLCYSRASFVYAYLRENQESFLDGHVRGFDYFGGVPFRMAYDNTSLAVILVGKGRDRALTDSFIDLRSHYLFESRFCNVSSGHEKGRVEHLVKYFRSNYLTPVPEFSSLDELNSHLHSCCVADLERVSGGCTRSIEELLKEEQLHFRCLPDRPFSACKTVCANVTKQSLVRFESNDYSVPVEYAHRKVEVKGFVDRVEVRSGSELVACHDRSYGRREYVLDSLHYVSLLDRKPGGIYNGRPFKGDPWGSDFSLMRRELEYRYDSEGTRKFIKILLLMSDYGEDAVKEAVGRCVQARSFSDDAVISELNYSPRVCAPCIDVSGFSDLQVELDGVVSASDYDALLENWC